MNTGSFHILATVNNTAAAGMHVFFWISLFIYFGYISGSGNARLYGLNINYFLNEHRII